MSKKKKMELPMIERLKQEFFNTKVVKTLEKGGEFGEAGFLANKVSGKRTATTFAGKMTLLAMLSKEDYLKIIGFLFKQ